MSRARRGKGRRRIDGGRNGRGGEGVGIERNKNDVLKSLCNLQFWLLPVLASVLTHLKCGSVFMLAVCGEHSERPMP